MADIQIPQRNPQYVAPINPTPLVEQYLDRKDQYQNNLNNIVNQIGQEAYQHRIQQQQLKAGAFEAGGPYLMNMLYGKQPAGTNAMNTPSGQMAGNVQPPPPNTALATPQGQMAGQQQPSTFHDQDPYGTIHASVSMGHSDGMGLYTQPNQGIGGQDAQAQYLAGLGLRSDQAGQLGMMGKFGTGALQGLKTVGDLALQPGQRELQNLGIAEKRNAIFMQPTEAKLKEQQYINAKEEYPTMIGKASAEQQNKYQLPEMKIQVANQKLQDLYDAYNKVPQSLKGTGIGLLTSKAGSVAGKQAPELVTYNKLREAAAVSLAIARNPENPRPSPQDIADELKNLPSVGDSPQVAHNLFTATSHDLQEIHTLNTQGAQSAANAFGGNVTPGSTPRLKTGAQNVPAISSQAQYDALPPGASYTWNGKPHIKGRS